MLSLIPLSSSTSKPECTRCLSEGDQGITVHLTTRQTVLKTFTKSAEHDFEREAEVLSRTKHPSIITLLAVHRFDDESLTALELEAPQSALCDPVDLFDYISANGPLDEHSAKTVFIQILDALLYLHSTLGYAHMDIKPENVVVLGAKQGTIDNVKLIDFCLAQPLLPSSSSANLIRRGSALYAAPEILRNKPGADFAKADAWSFGGLAFFVLTGRAVVPCQTSDREKEQRATHARICSGLLDFGALNSLSPKAKSFVLAFLRLSPSERMPLPEALAHPFLAPE